MTTHHLLHHFAQVTEAPAAVARLRQLVLDLAVRGKLVAQEPGDEPVSELLKRISAKKECLFAAGQMAKPEPLIPAEEDTLSFQLPPGWQIIPMNWLAQKLGAGSTPLGGKSVYQEEGVPFLRSQNVHNDGLRLDDVALIPRAVHERMAGTHIQQQDLLLNITGASIGRCTLVPSTFAEGNVSQHVAIIRLFEPAIREFIHLSLISPFYQQMIMDVQVGVSREGLSMQRLKLFPMVIPPLAEQQRIVAKVDELMTLCDELAAAQSEREARRDRLVAATLHRLTAAPADDPAPFPERARFYFNHLPRLTTRAEHIQGLRQTILNLAVQGKLVPQDPHDEPVDMLLKRITQEKARLIRAEIFKPQNWHAPEISKSLLPAIPASWQWVPVQDIVCMVTVGHVGSVANRYRNSGIPFLRSQNVRPNRFDPDGLAFIDADFHVELKKSQLNSGDVVVVRSGNVGVSCVIPESLGEANCADLVIIKRPLGVNARFLSYYINSITESRIEDNKVGIALSHFNTKAVAFLAVPLPPLAEQQRIVARVDELLALCDELAANLDTVTATRRRLLEAALAAALAAAQTDNRGALAQQLLGAGRHLSPDRDAVAELVAERAAEG